ncbi:MAG: hypothetical protein R3F42_04830 [Pseudomonadota bacterium]
MLSHILGQAYEFERIHGVAPNVVYINPLHFQALYREFPGLFEPAQTIRLGFRVVIIPASRLAHPEVSRLGPEAAPALQDPSHRAERASLPGVA